MSFSDNFKSVGSFGFRKLLHLPQVISKTLYLAFKHKISILYYPPSGPNLNPFLRDVIILGCTRIFFKKTIFHFRAAGVSEFLDQAPAVLKVLGKCVYRKPEAAIQLSALNPADGRYFNAKRIFIIKNGLEDSAKPFVPVMRTPGSEIRILYTGVLSESKGIMVIVEAARILNERNYAFHFHCIGDFFSEAFEKEVRDKCRLFKVEDKISFPGVKIGNEKWQYFLNADVFCFPSFFESESFGNVVVEAMMFELPVIGTYWRGIPDIIDDGDTGLLIPIKNPKALAESILSLGSDSERRKIMGKKGRQKFLAEYQLSAHLNEMEKMFIEVDKS